MHLILVFVFVGLFAFEVSRGWHEAHVALQRLLLPGRLKLGRGSTVGFGHELTKVES